MANIRQHEVTAVLISGSDDLDPQPDEMSVRDGTKASLHFNATPTGWVTSLQLSNDAHELKLIMRQHLPLAAFDGKPPSDKVELLLGTDDDVVVVYCHDGALLEIATCRHALEPFVEFLAPSDADAGGDEEEDEDMAHRPIA